MIKNKKLAEASDFEELDVLALAKEGEEFIQYVADNAPPTLALDMEEVLPQEEVSPKTFSEIIGRNEGDSYSQKDESARKPLRKSISEKSALAEAITRSCRSASVLLVETTNNCDVDILVKKSEMKALREALMRSPLNIDVARTTVASANTKTWPGFNKKSAKELSEYAHFELKINR